MNCNEINSLFLKVLEDIDLIMNDDFYNEKSSLLSVKEIIQNWYNNFQEQKTLKAINPENLKFADLEITDLFDKYLKTESVTNNFTERLSYDFGILKKVWKDQMLGEKSNI